MCTVWEMIASSGTNEPFIGRVESLFEKRGRMLLTVRWYYRPEDTHVGRQDTPKKGIFLSNALDENLVDTLAGRVVVMSFNEFKKMSTRSQQSKTVFF